MVINYFNFREPPLIILLLLACFASVSSVLFTPALPLIAEQFSITEGTAQLTMTFFLIGYAVGNLLYAPFANRFGRKAALYAGILLAVCGSIVILGSSAGGFSLFVLGRFLLALGSTAGINIVYTMLGDLYQGSISRKKFSSLSFAFSLGPSFAIALGGILTKHDGWESCYYFLIGYSFLLLFLASLLPETLDQKNLQEVRWKKLISNYVKQFKDKKVMLSALMMGTATSMVYVYVSEAPFIGIRQMGLSAQAFGLWSFIPPLGLMAGALISHHLAGKVGFFTIVRQGILTILAAAFAMFVVFSLGMVNVVTLFLLVPVVFTGNSMIYPNASSLAMSHAHDKASTSAVINFINLGLAFITVCLMQALPQRFATVLPIIFLSLGFLMIVWRWRLKILVDAEGAAPP